MHEQNKLLRGGGKAVQLLSFSGALCVVFALAGAFEGRASETRVLPSEDDSSRSGLLDGPERMDRFVVLNEKLKAAVCNEAVVSKAPSLDSISDPLAPEASHFAVSAPETLAEHDIVSFLLGDSRAGVFSDAVRAELDRAIKDEGAAGEDLERSARPQGALGSIKRRVSLDICQGLVDLARLKKLLHSNPSRFLEADALRGASMAAAKTSIIIEAIDPEGRFGQVGEKKRGWRTLVPGWLEAFEVDKVIVSQKVGGASRVYRRVSNPVTNNTQSIEVLGRHDVPLGILIVSHEQAEQEWAQAKQWADSPASRAKQIETYRMRIEGDAIAALKGQDSDPAQVRNLQEFYKNLLQAYQLFPGEKQFDAYAKASKPFIISIDDVTRNVLGKDFLPMLAQARVNGSHVKIGLFKPDPKLHAIYVEYSEKLRKASRQGAVSRGIQRKAEGN